MNRPRRALRVVFAAVLVVTVAALVGSYAAAGPAPGTPAGEARSAGSTPEDTGTPRSGSDDPGPTGSTDDANASGDAQPTRRAVRSIDLESRLRGANTSASGRAVDDLTVVATQGFFVTDEHAELVAFDDAGEVVFYDAAYRVYFDVDPVPGEPYTVEYVAAKHFSGEACPTSKRCTLNVVERANLTTGEVTRVWGRRTPGIGSTRWHDVDRLNGTHLVVADVYRDGVFAVNTTSDETVWRWNASEIYTRDQGGEEGDWTHINDVELLADGRIMVSVRNMDQVVFLEPCRAGSGDSRTGDGDGSCQGYTANESWSLGTDGDHETLYEQHNPDYIPEARGGPAVVVGDSENNRIVEYQRVDGAWTPTFTWRDARLQWPRDADRLPNGNTLVVDSHGDRVVELASDGTPVWSVRIGMPYDAERLGTGDESAGGQSMASLRGSQVGGGAGAGGGAGGQVDDGTGTDGPDGAGQSPGGDSNGPATAGLTAGDRLVLWLKSVVPSLLVNSALYVAPGWVRFTDLVVGAVLLGDVLAWGTLEWRWSGRSLRRSLQRLGAGLRARFGRE